MMLLTHRNNPYDKEPTMSRIVKIATASATILALLGLATPAIAATATDAGGLGCCISVH